MFSQPCQSNCAVELSCRNSSHKWVDISLVLTKTLIYFQFAMNSSCVSEVIASNINQMSAYVLAMFSYCLGETSKLETCFEDDLFGLGAVPAPHDTPFKFDVSSDT